MKKMNELANECLNCKNPMCKKHCPVSTNIPEFINCIKNNNMEEAYKILKNNNIMSEICSMICPVEKQCVGHCIKGIKGNPVEINKLEELVNLWGKNNKITLKYECKQDNNKKIAVIGAGPSGIACAVELRKQGYNVTIFEKEAKIGGILEYEIPDFRLEKSHIDDVENLLIKIGVEIKTNMEFGKSITLENLKEDGYRAVFLGIGAYVPNSYKITKEGCKKIYTSKTILRKYYKGEELNNFGETIVIGGGNVAMDVARTLKKAGNKSVSIYYRRNKELMPAIKVEQEEANKEGINFVYNTRVFEAICKDNKIEKIKCIKTNVEEGKVIDLPETEYEMCADSIVFAIGLSIDEEFLNNIGIKTKNGLVEIDESGMTSVYRNICRWRLNRKKSNRM